MNYWAKETKEARRTMEGIFGRPFARYFILQFSSEGEKRDMCPFHTEADLGKQIEATPISITSRGATALLVEVAGEERSQRLSKEKNVLDKECTVKEHTLFNGSKGLIYINNNDLRDLESFKQSLKEI